MNLEKHPKWPIRILKMVCPQSILEEIEGDLIQRFNNDVRRCGKNKAARIMMWNAMRYLRPAIIMRNHFRIQNSMLFMFGSYVKLSIRHLIKSRTYTVLNVSGLAIAMATSFFILQYLSFELGHDAFHENKDQLYRVTTTRINSETSATTFYGVASSLRDYFPEVINVTRLYRWPASAGILFMHDNKIFNEKKYVFADGEFFLVFPSLLWKGNPSTCLSDPNSIAISRRLALKVFGSEDVLGRTLDGLDKQKQHMVITAIIDNIPDNTHLDLDIVRPREWMPDSPWAYTNEYTYVTLQKNTDAKALESKANDAIAKTQKDNPAYHGIYLSLQPITDIHLNPQDSREIQTPGNKLAVYLIGIIFVVMLAVAWVNHINFETSAFLSRIKEIGLRKVIGSSKRDLILQFFTQSLCVQLIAILTAVTIIVLFAPYFTLLTGMSIRATALMASPMRIPFILFFLGLIATCLYPWLFLINRDLTSALKGKIANTISRTGIRKSLAVFQFTSAIVLIAFLLIVSEQIDFMRNAKLNINVNQILTIYNPANYSAYEDSLRIEKNETFRNRLLQHTEIESFTTSSAIPGEPIGFTYVDLAKRSMSDPDRQIPYKVMYIDYDFIPVFDLKLKAGRNYSRNQTDEGCLVVTESTIRYLGFSSSEEAIDKEIYFMEDDWDKWKIIGVVEDYRHEAIKTPVLPTIFRLHRNKGQMVYYSLLINAKASMPETVDVIEKEWKNAWPEKQFDYFFLSEFYDRQFKSEVNFKKVFTYFSGITVLISCFGLFGMTLLNVNPRLKEVSIRKVLGASPTRLTAMLSKDSIHSIFCSVLLSVPVVFWIGYRWLDHYPIHIKITWMVLATPVLSMTILLALTSGFHTLRAANSNPVKYLKSE